MIMKYIVPQLPLIFVIQVFMYDWAIGNHKLHIFWWHNLFLVLNGRFHTLTVRNQIAFSSSVWTLLVCQLLHFLINMLSSNKKIFGLDQWLLPCNKLKAHCPHKIVYFCQNTYNHLKNKFNLQLTDLFKLAGPKFHCLQSSDLFEVTTIDNL